MNNQASHVTNVGDVAVELDSVDKLPTGLHTTLDFKRQHRSGAPRGVFLGVGVGRVRRETGIVDTRDLGVCFQPLGHFLGVVAVALHPKRQGFDSLEQGKRVIGRDRSSHIAQQLHAGFDDVGDSVAQNTGVARAVIARVWFGESGELVHVLRPGECAAIDDGSDDDRAVSAEKLGG
ncbi:MAG: Uncharacterised protein [Cellulomonadaceae bacterium TMED98]|nr:MAG: Uncharacterised protein [Cellulomonadaceae bacterium TMED98]